jgi:hypothetical protein
MKIIGGLKHLQKLDLSFRPKLTDAGLSELANLTQLRSLDLTGTKVTDAGINHLAGMK